MSMAAAVSNAAMARSIVRHVVLPDAPGLGPREELLLGHQAGARERLVGFGGAAGVSGAAARVGENLPAEEVARVLGRGAVQERPRLVEPPEAGGSGPATREQRRDVRRPRAALDQSQRDFEERRVVSAVSRVGLEHPQRPRRRLALGGRQLDQIARGLPAARGAAHPETGGQFGVRGALARAGPAQDGGDGAGDGLDLVVAPLADEVVLDVTEAGLVVGDLFEDGPMPEERAGGVVAGRRVERGQPLVGLASCTDVDGALGGGEKLVGQARDTSGSQLGAFPRDGAERSARACGALGASQGAFLFTQPLVLVRGLEIEERARLAGGPGSPLFAPRGTVVEGRGDHALAELAERDVRGAGPVGLQEPFGGQRGVAVGDEEGFADAVQGRFDGIRSVRQALAHPAKDLVEVAGTPRNSFGEERRDGKRRRSPMGAFQERRAGWVGQDVLSAGHRLDARDGPADAVAQVVGEGVELGDQVEGLERRQGAKRDFGARVGGTRGAERLDGAGDLSRALGDEGRSQSARRAFQRRLAPGAPGLEGLAHVGPATGPRRHLERERADPVWRIVSERRDGLLDFAGSGGRREQSSEADERARRGRSGGPVRSCTHHLHGAGARRERYRRDSRRERPQTGGLRRRVEIRIRGRQRKTEERGKGDAIARAEGLFSGQSVRDDVSILKLYAPRGEGATRVLHARVQELSKPPGGVGAGGCSRRSEGGRQPRRRGRELRDRREPREQRRRRGGVRLLEGLPALEQDLVRRRRAGRRVLHVHSAQPQARADGLGDRRKEGRIGETERGARRLPATEGTRGPGDRGAHVTGGDARRLLEPLRRGVVVARGAQRARGQQRRVDACRSCRSHLHLRVERREVGGRLVG